MASEQRVKLSLEFDDTQAMEGFQRVANSAEKLGDTVNSAAKQGQAGIEDLGTELGTTDKVMANTVRTAKQYQDAIGELEDEINITNRRIREQRVELARLQKDYNNLANRTTPAAKALADQITKLSADIKANAANVSLLTDQTKDYRNALADLKGPLSDIANNAVDGAIENLGSRFGVSAQQARGLGSAAGRLVGRLGAAGSAAAAAGAAIVAIIAAPIITYFTNSGEAAEFFANKLSFLRGVAKEFQQRLFNLGEAIVENRNGIRGVTDALGDLFSGYGDAGRAAQEFDAIQRGLNKQRIEFISIEEDVNGQIAENRRLADDQLNSTTARIAALNTASRLESDLERNRQKFAQADIDLIRERFVGKEAELSQNVEFQKATAALSALQNQAAAREFSDQQALRGIRQQSIEQARQRREELERLADAIRKVQAELLALENSQLTGVAAIRAQGDAAVAAINEREAALRKEFAAKRQAFTLEDEFNRIRELTSNATEQRIREFIVKEQTAIRIARKETEQQAADDARASVQQRLQAAREAGQALEALQTTELAQLGARKAALEEQLRIIQQAFLDGLAPANAVTAIRTQLGQVEAEYRAFAERTASGLAGFKQKLFTALGIDEAGQAQLATLLQSLSSNFLGFLEEGNAGRIEALNQEIQLLESNISSLESQVDEQRKRQADGLANNLASTEAALKSEQAARRAALREREQEEAKAAKRRLAIDATQQASSIALAGAELAASGARGGVVGLLVALAGVALIARIVAQARNIGRQASRPQFREGTEYLIGPDHEHGGIPMYVKGKGYVDLEGGERIVSKDLNEQIRGMSNEALVKYAQIGQKVARGADVATVATTLAAAYAKAQAQQQEAQLQAIERAYREAADASADKMIAYWQTRPVRHITQDGEVIRFRRGAGMVEQVIRKTQ